ncbi:type II restriction endonuclease [Neisseria meningitidis]|uniref:type II restriction endonuclease n=1 Tax=Neisseria meningitidis TaxID=487 RepID=UPI000E56E12B|nr:type II restriction endonuclease [Neisseria meningitidis]
MGLFKLGTRPSYQENIVFNASDKAMQNFAKNHLGYQHEKGLDFIAKFNNKFIIGEAKFLTDFGGHQNAQFNDAITTMRAPLAESDYTVQTIAILDGVLYIKGQNKMFKDLSSFKDNEVVISTVLLRDYLFSV